MKDPLLLIDNLTVGVQSEDKEKILIQDVHLEMAPLEILALVGSSGSGKTTTGLAVMKLLPDVFKIHSGQVILDGENLLAADANRMREVRGRAISMVFQEPLYAFNPLMTIGEQIGEVFTTHSILPKTKIRSRILELLAQVEINDPARVAGSYPHQLSGGMRQRAMIAQAIAGEPKLLIADEPTSNLDVTLQANIMELFRKLKKEFRLSIMLITHDLGMVAHLADRVAVLAQGKVVEYGVTQDILQSPKNPFTKKLMNAFMV